ncbi:MAG TPA: SDR family oxidoreductase [Kofleriaceae bacterium]|nr:SDR family oxidoreductase [Kofleriaceae bacterium]
MSNANVLVTGSNSGFGRLTSLALARRGHTVFATMRGPDGKNRGTADELRRIAETEQLALHVLELDVTDQGSVDRAVAAALAKAGHLDAVINNAGYGLGGLNETVTPEQTAAIFDTNVVGVQRVNRAVLPGMRERRSGLIVHLSSGLGRVLIPFVGIYAATKWAVEAIAETYRYELKPAGVDVTIVQPGAFPTNFGPGMAIGADQARAAGYGPLADGLAKFGEGLQQMFSIPNAPDPQEVAEAIVELVEAPAGKRPARVSVDRFQGQGVVALNDAHANVQKLVLGGMGMPMLAD